MSNSRNRHIKFMLYAHDGRGLGHIMRMCNIAGYIKDAFPLSSILCVSGSSEAIGLLPPKIEYIKLPSYKSIYGATKTIDRLDCLNCSVKSVIKIRSSILFTIGEYYKPQILIVDFLPMGKKQELVQCIKKIKSDNPQARIILGLRGVIDSNLKTKNTYWSKQNISFLNEYYDKIFIYSDPRICPISQLLMPKVLRKKAEYTGYVSRKPDNLSLQDSRLHYCKKNKLLLVSGGSGWHSYGTIKKILQADRIAKIKIQHETLVITGPKISSGEFRSLQKIVLKQKNITLLKFVTNYMELLFRSDIFIGRAGYNSIIEILNAKKPAIFITKNEPEKEQEIHLKLLNKFIPLPYFRESKISLEILAKYILELLSKKIAGAMCSRLTLNLNGGENIVHMLRRLISDS